MSRKAATKVSADETCITYTYCDHLSDGWYDYIKTFWKVIDVYVCAECRTVIQLKKNQKIEEYNIVEHGQLKIKNEKEN